MYNLAATNWHQVSRKPPVYGEDSPLAETVPGVSTRLEQALRVGLRIHPERRISPAEEFAEELGMPLGGVDDLPRAVVCGRLTAAALG